MNKNIGTSDRIFRGIIAFALLFYALWEHSWIAGLVSFFVFYEVLASWCVFYHFIGKNTCPLSTKGSSEDSDISTKRK